MAGAGSAVRAMPAESASAAESTEATDAVEVENTGVQSDPASALSEKLLRLQFHQLPPGGLTWTAT